MFSFFEKVKIDWWEFSNLGIVGYFHFLFDWVKYLIGISNVKPILFSYSEIDMDLDFDFSKDTDDPSFNRFQDLD